MARPKRYRLLHEATPDEILKYSNCPLYLPISLTIANSNVAVDEVQPFVEPCKAAQKLSADICVNTRWLAPTGNQITKQELSSPLAV